MKVKFATQIFSRTVASNLGYVADKGILTAECKQSADLVLFLDNIFDSINNSKTKFFYTKRLLSPGPGTFEFFFSVVKSPRCHNNNPTCDQFESTFATLLLNNLNSVHILGVKCENDHCQSLHDLIINDNRENYVFDLHI